MKKVSLTVIFVHFLFFNFYAQEIQVNSTTLDSIEKKVEKLQDSLEKLKEAVENDSINELTTGKFTFFEDHKIPIYIYGNNKYEATGDSVDIKKIILDIREGQIYDIQVITHDNTTFTNRRATIEVNRFSDRCDLLGFKRGTEIFYVQSCDFLRFERFGNYISEDAAFTLYKKGESKTLTKNVGINQVFNIKLYTDLLGALGGEQNGLVQTEAEFMSPFISTNVRNKSFYFLNYFRSNFNVSRFDDKFKYSVCDSSFSRQTLLQRSWLASEVAFNLFSGLFQPKSNSNYAIDMVGGFSLANVIENSDSSTVAIPYYGLEPRIKISVSQNMGFKLSAPILWQRVPQLTEEKEIIKRVIIPEFEINWNPLKNPGSKIFGRVKYFTMQDEDNPFWQVQIGYNLALSEIVNKKIE